MTKEATRFAQKFGPDLEKLYKDGEPNKEDLLMFVHLKYEGSVEVCIPGNVWPK